MQGEATNTGWNELQFVSWGEFKRMAPSILELEVARLGRLIQGCPADAACRNSLVQARHSLRRFIDCLGRSEREGVGRECVGHLGAAIMSIALPPDDLDEQTKRTCRYVLDRLQYVYHRIGLIY